MTLPTFIVIGAAKGGTTSLADYLSAHPEVFVAREKEVRFFSRNWHLGVDWYQGRFADAGDACARGEASPNYTFAAAFPNVPKRMAAVVPHVKLIYLVRDPVERIRSHYAMNVGLLGERRPLQEVVWSAPWYFDPSRYAHQLDRYLEVFDREQLMVVNSERLRTHRAETLGRVFSFIGVEPVELPGIHRELNQSSNVGKPGPVVAAGVSILRKARVLRLLRGPTKRRLRRKLGRPVTVDVPPDLEAEIWGRLEPDLARLREIVGPDFDLWGRA